MVVKAAVFDLDGTMYPYSRLISASMPLALRYPRLMTQFARVRAEIRGIRPIEDFQDLQARLLAARLRVPVAGARRMIQEIIYARIEERFQAVQPFPQLRRMLAELKQAGIGLAVLSDFPVRRKLSYLGLDGMWDLVLSSEETNYLKPNPEPFLEVAARLGIAPAEILFVGDKYHYDILGAHNVGMRTAHLARFPQARGVADVTFRSYENFASLIRGIRPVSSSHPPKS